MGLFKSKKNNKDHDSEKRQNEDINNKNTESKVKTDLRTDDIDEADVDDNIIEVKRTMGRKGKILVALTIMIIAVGLITAMVRYNMIKTYRGYDVVASVKTTGDNIADYVVFAGNVLKITKDGASYVDEKGNVKWDVSYAMKMPQAEVCGDYAVVADMNGKEVYVFNTSGEVSRQTLNYDIANMDVAEQGVYCLVLVGDGCNYIQGYDKDSSNIYELKTSIDKSGYPLDIDISNDGQKLVTSFMKVNGTKTATSIATYNFGSVGKNENADRMMGSYDIQDAVYPIVKFVDNDTIACFGDADIRIYTMTEKPKKKAVIDLKSREMQGVFSNSSYIGYIALADSGSASKYKIYVYDTSGKSVAETDCNTTYDTIYATDDEIIVIGDMDCNIYRFNGSLKFQYSFTKKLVNVVPDSNKEEYVVIFENETQTVKLKNN